MAQAVGSIMATQLAGVMRRVDLDQVACLHFREMPAKGVHQKPLPIIGNRIGKVIGDALMHVLARSPAEDCRQIPARLVTVDYDLDILQLLPAMIFTSERCNENAARDRLLAIGFYPYTRGQQHRYDDGNHNLERPHHADLSVLYRRRGSRSQPPIDKFYAATGEVIARVEPATSEMLDEAVVIASEAQRNWAALEAGQRGEILQRAASLMRAQNDELAAPR